MSATLSQLDRLTAGHGYAPGSEPSYWARFLDDFIGVGNASYFYVLICLATTLFVGAMVRARLRRAEAARLSRLGRTAHASSGARRPSGGPASRAEGARDDLAALRRARARQAKAAPSAGI